MLAVLLGPALGLPGKRGPLHGPDGKVIGPTLDQSLQPDPPSKMATPPSPKAQADPNDPKAQAGAAEPPALWDTLSKEFDAIVGEKKDIAWGSQIRSYVFQPYQMVKDHRTGHEVGNVESVMDGALDGFIDAYLRKQKES